MCLSVVFLKVVVGGVAIAGVGGVVDDIYRVAPPDNKEQSTVEFKIIIVQQKSCIFKIFPS